MISTENIGNKFEFISVAGERCKQLQRGARARVETTAHKAVTIAMQEVISGVIPYSYGPFPEEYPVEELAEVTTETYPVDGAGLENREPGT